MDSRVFVLSEIDQLSRELVPVINEHKIMAFYGGLGAGKTTLIRALCAQLDSKDTVTSPTFNYLNIYRAANGFAIYHFDLYRLKTMESFYDLGFAEYLQPEKGCVCIEWPEIIESILPPNTIRITLNLDKNDPNKRTITVR